LGDRSTAQYFTQGAPHKITDTPPGGVILVYPLRAHRGGTLFIGPQNSSPPGKIFAAEHYWGPHRGSSPRPGDTKNRKAGRGKKPIRRRSTDKNIEEQNIGGLLFQKNRGAPKVLCGEGEHTTAGVGRNMISEAPRDKQRRGRQQIFKNAARGDRR